MFKLLLTVCINGDPALCMDRHVPVAEPMGIMRCLSEGVMIADQWLALHPDLTLQKWTCDPRPPKADPFEDRPPFSVTEVAPGVFVHPGLIQTPAPGNAGDLANIGFVVGDEAIAVIDAGGSRRVAEELYGAIRQVSPLPVRWLILTHMHPDHVLGAEVFREAGARIVGHERLAEALASRAESYTNNIRRLIGERAWSGTRIMLPDEGVAGTREIDLGNRVLTLTAHGTAHTDNDLTVLDRRTDTLWAGDLVFAEHAPALDGSVAGWLGRLDALADQPVERIVPGHGPISLPWPDGLAPTRTYLAALAAETRAAIAAGKTISEAAREVGQSQRGAWALFDEYNARNATSAFQELEWE